MKKTMNTKTTSWTLIGFVLIIMLLQPILIIYGAEGDYIDSWKTHASDTPYDITTDGINIWILDFTADKVYKYDMTGGYIDSWDTDGQCVEPRGITTDGSNIWIVDANADEVYRYDMTGEYTTVHWDTGDANDPRGIATDGTKIWIVDTGTDEVYKYTMIGFYVDSWDTGAADDSFSITTDGSNIWIVNGVDRKAYKYNMTGGFIGSWGTPGVGAPVPYGIATDGSNIWIVCRTPKEVYKLDMAGGEIDSWDTGGANDASGITKYGSNIWIVDNSKGYPPGTGNDTVHKFNLEGGYIGSWDVRGYSAYTDGITTDGSNIWIVNRQDDEVYKYNMAGGYIGSWDISGQSDAAYGIATDGSNIWIVDSTADKVYKYNMTGGYIDSWSTGDAGSAQGIATDGSNILIVDASDDEVYRFNMAGVYNTSWDISVQSNDPKGITTDGTSTWIVDRVDNNAYKYEGSPGPIPPSPPVPSNVDSNETKEGELCAFSTYWDDAMDDGLDYWIFSWDESGSYVNDTKVAFPGNPDKGWSNITKTLPFYPQTVKWKIYANDTLGNMAVTEEQTLVVTILWSANVTLPDDEDDGYTDDETVDDFDWGASWGDSAFWYTNHSWVFEGKRRYSFQVTYQKVNLGTVKQIGLRFTDAMEQNHTIWYDKEDNILTVTSPYDGISGWVHSFTQTDTTVTSIFQIMFNKPIPDSYGVQLQIRIVGNTDSGWLTPTGGIFNIYNLGGLSTLYKSGTAGRMPGGDIFEIYAADTRTRNIIPLQDFDVRASNLAPGVQIAGVQIVEAGDEQKLIDELFGWKIWMTSRTEARTIYPTNRLPATASDDDQTYVSYPFGLLIKSDSTLDQSLMIEKEFFRTIKTTDKEKVTVEFWATVANDTKITGQILVSDDGYVDDAIAGTWSPSPSDSKRIVDFKFYGNGSIRLMDGVSNIYPATYSGMVWANYTFVIDLDAQTYDFYVDDILNRSAIGFREAATSVGHITLLDTLNPVFPAQPVEFYVDDIWVHTNFTTAYGGVSEGTMLFDKNQHWSMDFDFFVEDGQVYAQGASGTPRRVDDDYSNYGYLEFGWDIMINKTMVHDFLVARVNITDGHISGKNDWIQFNVTWYQNGTYVKNDILYGLFEGYSLFPGDSKDTCGFHWDIWFNRANASTVVGARINTEYYGMSDKSVWWAVWSSKWTAMRSEVSESTLFVDLEDAKGFVPSAQEVSFVRSWVKVLRDTRGQFAYKVLNIAGLDFPIARDTMSGIDTPPIRETLVPEVASGWFGSFIGGIFTAALKRLGNLLMGFGMGLFSLSIDFIDHVFAALGYPALLTTIFSWMDSLFASVPTLVGYGMTLIGQIFSLISTSAGNTLNQTAAIITIWINMYTITMNLLTGVLTPGINIWNDLGVSSFIQIGAILYPFWLLMYGLENGMQAVIDHVNGVLNIGSFFLNFILNVAGFFVSLLTGLIGAIRG